VNKGERTRATIVDATSRLLRRQGYAATGLNQIIDDSGAPKGSLYFHFPEGKDELVAAALGHAADEWRAELLASIGDETDLAKSLTLVGERIAKELESSAFKHGCPLATVTLEAAATNPALRAVISDRYGRLETEIANRITAAGVPAKQARASTLMFLSALEGALLLARAHKDASIVRTVVAQLAQIAAGLKRKK
jgi:TetR/AcrR family transcriptional repressor of lmrAB and yxaGH operons